MTLSSTRSPPARCSGRQVSDKRGIVEFARGLADLGRRAGLDRRHRARAGRSRARRPRDRGPHRLPRDHGRARQDAAPEALRGRCSRCATTPSTCARRPSTTSSSSTWSASTSIRSSAPPARASASDAEVIENIDVGGPTMIRAAAKNHAYTAVVTSPESYDAILDELRELATGGSRCRRARASPPTPSR